MQENLGKFATSFGTHSANQYHHDMSDARGLIEYPLSRQHPRFVRARLTQIERGIDPKETWLGYCKPSCQVEKARSDRC
jgi:hypothetical protein